MTRIALRLAATAALGLCIAGCGGGGGASLASTPTPPPPPSPPPPPPVIAPAHIGLVSSAPFAVQGVSIDGLADVQFSYDASTNTYQISLPGFQPGSLIDTGYSGTNGQPATGSFSWVSAGSSTTRQEVGVNLPVPGTSVSPYTYTSLGWWSQPSNAGVSQGVFAYGIPTASGDVPITGTASYTAEIHALTTLVPNFGVGGTASLQFNFGAGTLNGFMHPEIVDGFNGIFVDFGRYDFTQTVYSTGSTTFSGKFIVPGLPGADSSFNGNFNGPAAAELMARFQAPALINGQQGTISGIWIGRKGN